MSRVLSYDHGPAPYDQRKEVALNKGDLAKHVGRYSAPHAGQCRVIESNGFLELTFGDKTFQLHPESKTMFFLPDRDLTIEFASNKMIVRESGNIVEEAVRMQ